MAQEYKVLNIQRRKEWSNDYGTFQDYALQLEGIDGWVSKSQKPDSPEPVVGSVIYGSITSKTVGDNTFQKFKSEKNPNFGGGNSIFKEDIAYMILMLEELTLRREQPDNPTPRDRDIEAITSANKPKDNIPSYEDGDKPINLESIPF